MCRPHCRYLHGDSSAPKLCVTVLISEVFEFSLLLSFLNVDIVNRIMFIDELHLDKILNHS